MYQRITIIGDIGRDPEMRYTPAGTAVTNFSVAVSKKYQKSGEWKTETLWFRVSVWGNMAEPAFRYLSKGSRVMVEGEMKAPHVYKKNDESWDAQLEMTAATVKFLDKKSNGEKKAESNPYDVEEEYEGFVP